MSDKNLTGEHTQQVLDVFLYKALEPIILHTDVFDHQVAYVLHVATTNRKRKPSSLDRDKAINLLSSFLFETDRTQKFKLLRESKIERSFLHMFATRYLDSFSDFLPTYKEFLEAKGAKRRQLGEHLDSISTLAGCKSRRYMYVIMTVARSYLKGFYEVRAEVISRYMKQASTQAKSYVTQGRGLTSDYNDVRQAILKNQLIAVDKYDSDKGALTSYMKQWAQHAQTCNTAEHEYGVAYTIPQTQRKKIVDKSVPYYNRSVSLDSLVDAIEGGSKDLHAVLGDSTDQYEDVEREQEQNIVRRIAKLADTRGCGRLFLDIGELFSEEEIRRMREHTIKECK